MKFGVLLLALGVGLIVLSVVLKSQFNALATSQETPEPGSHPLVERLIPEVSADSSPQKPEEMARTVTRRIIGIGAGGLLCVVAGGLVVFTQRSRAA